MTKADWDTMGKARKRRYWKDMKDNIVGIKNYQMREKIVYLRK